MKRYWTIVIGIFTFLLSLFLLVEALGIHLLTDPSDLLARGGLAAAVLGVSLLVADIVLPVPSSLVMIALGALFGVVGGTLLSLAGSAGAALTGFAIGRRGGRLMTRIVTPAERARVDRFLGRWGALALVVTRPIPLVAETAVILAGASAMTWKRATIASLIGSLAPALLYSLTGSVAASFRSGALMFGLVVMVSGSFWLVSRWID